VAPVLEALLVDGEDVVEVGGGAHDDHDERTALRNRPALGGSTTAPGRSPGGPGRQPQG